MGVVVYTDKQTSLPKENLSDKAQVERFTDKIMVWSCLSCCRVIFTDIGLFLWLSPDSYPDRDHTERSLSKITDSSGF